MGCATLLAAHFPRSYIDANRTLDDLDPALLDAPWPTPLDPSEKTRLGYGLIWRNVNATTPIYARKLPVAEVQQRIKRCYQPYHEALATAIEHTHAQFGAVWHLNLHSMPNNAYERLQIHSAHPLADFVLGDRDGTTCEPAFVDLVERELGISGKEQIARVATISAGDDEIGDVKLSPGDAVRSEDAGNFVFKSAGPVEALLFDLA